MLAHSLLFIVSNSILFEINVIFSPWTEQVMNLNLLLQSVSFGPKLPRTSQVLGLLQLLEARELGESISDLMPTPGGVSHVSIYQISEQQFSRVLIGSRNSEYPWLFTVLRPEPRWRLVSRFSEDEICAINKVVVQTNTKKATNFGLSVSTGRQKIILMLNLQHYTTT